MRGSAAAAWMDWAAVFFFASLIAFLKWRESRQSRRRWLAASVALFAGAMFTKETMVFIPILIAAYLWLTTPRCGPHVADRCEPCCPTGWCGSSTWRSGIRSSNRPARAPNIFIQLSHSAICGRRLMRSGGTPAPGAALGIERGVHGDDSGSSHAAGFVLPAAGLARVAGGGLVAVAAAALDGGRLSDLLVCGHAGAAGDCGSHGAAARPLSLHSRVCVLRAGGVGDFAAWESLPAKARLVAALCVVALWSGLTWHEMGYWDCDATLWSRVLQISPSNLKAQVQLAFLYTRSRRYSQGSRHAERRLALPSEFSESLAGARQHSLTATNNGTQARAAYLKVMQLTEPAPGQAVQAGPPTQAAGRCRLSAGLDGYRREEFHRRPSTTRAPRSACAPTALDIMRRFGEPARRGPDRRSQGRERARTAPAAGAAARQRTGRPSVRE